MGQTTTLCNLSMAIRLSDSGWRLITLPRRARMLLGFANRAAPGMARFRGDGAIRCNRGMIPLGTSCKPIGKLTGWTMPGQEAARGSLFPILKGPTRVCPCTNFFSPTRETVLCHSRQVRPGSPCPAGCRADARRPGGMDAAVGNDAPFLPHHDRLVPGRVALRLHGGL